MLRQSMKFSALIPSSKILTEIMEEVAFNLIQNQDKIDFILKTKDIKEGIFSKFSSFISKSWKKVQNYKI